MKPRLITLNRFFFVTPVKTLQRAIYGEGNEAVEIVVNYGQEDILVLAMGGETFFYRCWIRH
jgi:hypothetical protein